VVVWPNLDRFLNLSCDTTMQRTLQSMKSSRMLNDTCINLVLSSGILKKTKTRMTTKQRSFLKRSHVFA
jgi:hypothetical protein